jgi:carboxyl-terminal processing protease
MENKNKLFYFYFSLISLALAGGAFFVGTYVGYEKKAVVDQIVGVKNKELPSITEERADFTPFWTVWKMIDDNFVDGNSSTSSKKITDQDRVWGATKGLVASLGDPYSVFMSPKEKDRFESDISGSFSGVGMEVGMKDGLLTVISALPDTPAKRAGILSGDKILKIGGTSTADMTIDEAISFIRGPKGSVVTLTIGRDTEKNPIDIAITRDIINIPTIDTKELGNGVFLIRLYNFSAPSSQLFREALRKFIESGSDKLILDLRGNPGGYLESAVDMASWFLPKDKPVVIERHRPGQEDKIYRSSGYDIFNKNLKMVILVDQGTASASEILAGALSEYGVAKLVGDKTFGKGSVQQVFSVTKDTLLKLTIARWYTPKGKSISHSGLEPDVKIKVDATDLKTNKDRQLEKAIEILTGDKQLVETNINK